MDFITQRVGFGAGEKFLTIFFPELRCSKLQPKQTAKCLKCGERTKKTNPFPAKPQACKSLSFISRKALQATFPTRRNF